jgi:spore coat polysaccharide biosynthesis protein SpsF (cytidylyltransferase family)
VSTLAVVQARMGSTRLPGKVLMALGPTTVLELVLARLGAAPVDEIVVATSDRPLDDPVAAAVGRVGVACVRGSEHDVLDRFALALLRHPADEVVRITADCPLVDPHVVAAALAAHRAAVADYTSNTLLRTFPDGLDVEVVDADALRIAAREADEPAEREHVTPFIYRRPVRFRVAQFSSGDPRLGRERWTLDDADDLVRLRHIADQLDDVVGASWPDVLAVVGRRAVFDDVDVVPDLDGRNDGRSRTWTVLQGDAVVGAAMLAVDDDTASLRLDVAPDLRSAARAALRRALRADAQVTEIEEVTT